MTKFFLDTGYILALEIVNDQNHTAAMSHWQQIRRALSSVITTSAKVPEYP